MRMLYLVLAVLLAAPLVAPASRLGPKTEEAFQEYVWSVERTVARRAQGEEPFLWVDESPANAARVRRGEVVISHFGKDSMTKVKDGMIHDWVGAIFVPGVTLNEALSFSKDFDHHEEYYQPEVMDSKLLGRDGEKFHIYYRLLKKKVITVVLDTEHDVEYFPLDEKRAYSRSRTTRVSELKHAGSPNEVELPDGTGGGYLWRLNSYWRFQERDGGVYIELRAVSLTRGIPLGLGWLIKPIVRDMPRISITATLNDTRDALVQRHAAVANSAPGDRQPIASGLPAGVGRATSAGGR